MAWELTTVADDEVVAFDGTEVAHWVGLEPDTDHDLDGLVARTLPRPPGERLATVATVNDVHFGEVACGILDGWADPVMRAAPGEDPYPEVMSRAAVDEIAAADPDLVVVKGDLTAGGRPEEYAAFLACYEPAFGDRLLHVRGNHESRAGATFAATPVQVRELPGATVVLLDTSVEGIDGGALHADQLEQLDEVARTADVPVLVFGHHHLTEPEERPSGRHFGIDPADAAALRAVVARRPAIRGWFAGHTHRNHVRRFPETGDVPFVEVACVKDHPGGWAEYGIFEGGVLQVFRRIAAPEALDWSERTRHMFAGLYHDYAFGRLEDRCFALPSR